MSLGLFMRFGGFSLIGVVNTLLSMALIFVLNECLCVDYRVSYVVSYVVTIMLAYVANARLVFHVPLSRCDALGFLAAYMSGMVVGVACLWGLRKLFPDVNATMLSYVVVLVTLVWNFVFVNKVLSRKNSRV